MKSFSAFRSPLLYKDFPFCSNYPLLKWSDSHGTKVTQIQQTLSLRGFWGLFLVQFESILVSYQALRCDGFEIRLLEHNSTSGIRSSLRTLRASGSWILPAQDKYRTNTDENTNTGQIHDTWITWFNQHAEI